MAPEARHLRRLQRQETGVEMMAGRRRQGKDQRPLKGWEPAASLRLRLLRKQVEEGPAPPAWLQPLEPPPQQQPLRGRPLKLSGSFPCLRPLLGGPAPPNERRRPALPQWPVQRRRW